MESSSSNNIFAAQIGKVIWWCNDIPSQLHNYRIGRDELRRPIYITGTELTEENEEWAKMIGTPPPVDGTRVDKACHIIPAKLGGNSFTSNVFPLNSTLDRSNWDRDNQRVYDFVAGENNRHVLLSYAVEYGTRDNDIARVVQIHYHFLLHDDSDSTDTSIEGHFENTNSQPYYPTFQGFIVMDSLT